MDTNKQKINKSGDGDKTRFSPEINFKYSACRLPVPWSLSKTLAHSHLSFSLSQTGIALPSRNTDLAELCGGAELPVTDSSLCTRPFQYILSTPWAAFSSKLNEQSRRNFIMSTASLQERSSQLFGDSGRLGSEWFWVYV